MGYYSTVTEDSYINFETPLTIEQIDTVEDILDYTSAFFSVTPTGLVKIQWCGEYKAYGLEDEIKQVVALFPAKGVVTVFGEEQGDIWRLVIDGSSVREEKPKLLWPDGTFTDTGRN